MSSRNSNNTQKTGKAKGGDKPGKGKTGASKDSEKNVQAQKGDNGKGKTGESKDFEKNVQAQKGDNGKGKTGEKQSNSDPSPTQQEKPMKKPKSDILDVQVKGKTILPNSWKPADQSFSGLYQSLTGTGIAKNGPDEPRLNKPRLVVSVIGDEVEDIPVRLQQEFQEGITALLKTQDLWLLTRKPCQKHGGDTGLIRLVHRAAERLSPKEQVSAVVIGVGTTTCTCIKVKDYWRTLRNYVLDKTKDKEVGAEQSTSDRQMSQNETSAEESKNEKAGNKPDIYTGSIVLDGANDQAVANFIAEFQSYICPSEKDSEPIATSVSLIFGGTLSMNTWPLFEKGMPVVIVKDSGGAADYIFSCVSSGEVYEKDPKEPLRSIADIAEFIVAKNKKEKWEELVHVCVLDGEPYDMETKGLKAAVLRAAIHWHEERGKKLDKAPKPRRFSHQMIELSLLLDESQLAKTHIFDKEYEREKKERYEKNKENRKEENKQKERLEKELADNKEKLKDAFVNNQPNFVKLFLEAKYKYCGLDKFVEDDVIDLYESMLGEPQAKTDDAIVSLIRGLIKGGWSKDGEQEDDPNNHAGNSRKETPATSKPKNDPEQVRKIENVISQLVGPYYKLTGIYTKPDDEGCCSCCYKSCTSQEKKKEELKIDIGTHLFLWAVLFNRIDIAFFFWQHGSIVDSTAKHPHIIMALMASTILANLAKKAEDGKEPALQEQLAKHAKLFEVRASDVLMECSISDRHSTQDLLIREHTRTIWGEGTSLLSAAFAGKRKYFLERMPCQVKLAAVWRGQIVWSTPTWKIFLATIIPILIGMLKFTENESPSIVLRRMLNITKSDSKTKNDTSESKKAYSVGLRSPDVGDKTTNKTKSTVSFITAWLYLYSAPIAKYYCFTISYMVFLGIFSLTCLTNLHPGYPSVFEWIVWGWIIIFMAEEIIEVQSAFAFGNTGLRIWFHNKWNRFDGILYFIVSPLCFLLRIFLVGEEFQHARHAFAITLACYFFRFLQSYYAFREVGSKVLIIFHMMKDLFKFGLVLGVFVLSYGMAITIILYPNRTISWDMLRYVLYSPFWQIFVRDAFVDRVDGEDGSTICTGNSFNTTIEGDSPCRVNSQFGDALLILYTMFTNVLLLNILIAMFNSTYERIQRESNTWWHYNRYSLVYEYLEKPRLAPPLIVFSYLHRILRWLFSCAKGCRCQCTTDGGLMCTEVDDDTDDTLTHFERINMEKLMERQEKQNEVRKRLDELGLAPKQSEREWEADMLDDDDDNSDDDEMQTGIALAMHQMVKSLPETISRKLGGGKNPPQIRRDRMDVMEKKLDKLTQLIEKKLWR